MVKVINYMIVEYKISGEPLDPSNLFDTRPRKISYKLHSFNFDSYRFCFSIHNRKRMSLRGIPILLENRISPISQDGESFKLLLIGRYGIVKVKYAIIPRMLRRLNDRIYNYHSYVLAELNIT
jgi:hypothetical protein